LIILYILFVVSFSLSIMNLCYIYICLVKLLE
jgi:hypothetical protein